MRRKPFSSVCWRWRSRSAYSAIPEAPGTIRTPRGPSIRISSSGSEPSRKSSSVCCGVSPSRILMLARPVSASKMQTRLPWRARLIARLVVILVLPTPPLPLVIAMTRARVGSGRCCSELPNREVTVCCMGRSRARIAQRRIIGELTKPVTGSTLHRIRLVSRLSIIPVIRNGRDSYRRLKRVNKSACKEFGDGRSVILA